RECLRKLIQEYHDLFPEQLPKGIPPSREVKHRIDVEPGSKPPYRPPYRLGPAEQDELEEQIKDLLAQGFIRPSCNPYGAPVLFVPKKDGRWWMCIDYRALNKQTVKDRYPLPRIELLLDRLGQARVFSKLDLAQGYHQIAMSEDSVEKTAFCTNIGQWEHLVMPFGLCNAPSTFQRLMNTVFERELNSFILVYLDDILVFSRSIGDHWGHLRQAFDRLRRAKLYARLHKCEFLKDKVDYLGFEVGRDGIRTSPEKVRAILDWPRPQSTHDVRSFLGLASYYRKIFSWFLSACETTYRADKGKSRVEMGQAREAKFPGA
ncbi:MAG: reverse transcriptase family protein, partial [Cohaesibacter sp.]|nr:reverse transcriptase family protein [Cohaesibacter sp.]